LVPQSFLNISGTADILSTFWCRRHPLDLPGDADFLSTFLVSRTPSRRFYCHKVSGTADPHPLNFLVLSITFQNSLI
jgi:hypothetical protein